MILPLQAAISFCVTPSPRALSLGWEILPLRGAISSCVTPYLQAQKSSLVLTIKGDVFV